MTTIPLVDETRFVAMILDSDTSNQRWAERAACAHLSLAGDPYFPEDGETPPTDALARCASCPVADECLATALVHEAVCGYRFGWWGGLGPAERELLAADLALPEPTPVKVDLRSPAAIARHLRAQRRTVPAIAAELGCTERTVYRYLAASAA
jgi:hypothetical protein